MKIPLIDLVAQYQTISEEIDAAIRGVLESGQFILGPNVASLESEVAGYVGVRHAVGVASGTDALVLALRAAEIGAGDEVIVPAYTFFATAEAVMLVGATPVFVDIDLDSYALRVEQVAECITDRTRAIIPVHLYGQAADMLPLLDLARSNGLLVVEDNAQAFGAEYHDQRTGSLGDIGCLSFFPTKNLGSYGDGGMVVTNNPMIAERVRMLRTHGWRAKYDPEMVGYNSRLDELQAAILRVKLRHVDEWNEQRRRVAAQYAASLPAAHLTKPVEVVGNTHVYHAYVVRLDDRDQVQQNLSRNGIGSTVYYPRPLHVLAPCRSLGYAPGQFPLSEQASQQTLALPMYPEMKPDQVRHVARVVAETVNTAVPSAAEAK